MFVLQMETFAAAATHSGRPSVRPFPHSPQQSVQSQRHSFVASPRVALGRRSRSRNGCVTQAEAEAAATHHNFIHHRQHHANYDDDVLSESPDNELMQGREIPETVVFVVVVISHPEPIFSAATVDGGRTRTRTNKKLPFHTENCKS